MGSAREIKRHHPQHQCIVVRQVTSMTHASHAKALCTGHHESHKVEDVEDCSKPLCLPGQLLASLSTQCRGLTACAQALFGCCESFAHVWDCTIMTDLRHKNPIYEHIMLSYILVRAQSPNEDIKLSRLERKQHHAEHYMGGM